MTGVIIGIADSITQEQAERISATFVERFPGVTFVVVGQCAAIATFTYDDDDVAS